MYRNIAQVLKDIGVLHDRIGDFINIYQNKPLPNSRADCELRGFTRSESLITAYSQGGILIEVAADQLMGLTKTLTEPAQAMAPYTCVRAVIESCALASWLLSPSIDAETRVQRSIAFRYEGLSQQVKYLKATRYSEETITKLTKHIDDIDNLARTLGFTKVVDKKGKRIGIGQEMPPITILVKTELDEEPLYRLLSAMAHAHPWTLQILSFRLVTKDNYEFLAGLDDNIKIHTYEKNLDPNVVIYLCCKAVTNFIKPVWHQCQLYGWEEKQLVGYFNNAYISLGIRDELRFWENNFASHRS